MNKEHPILFSTPMVKAILAGKKTVTRRVAKPPFDLLFAGGAKPSDLSRAPYGEPGDRLWVRETWRTDERATNTVWGIRFRADDAFVEIEKSPEAADRWIEAHGSGKHGVDWRPSIFMRPWMCRIRLEITDVRVERIQSITDEQACAEGTPCWVCGRTIDGLSENDCACFHSRAARDSFEVLWDSINGKRAPWKGNPWVWAVSFKRIEAANV